MTSRWELIEVSGELLLIAWILGRYGTAQSRKIENTVWLSLSAFLGAAALSIVAIIYIALFPLFIILKHIHLFISQVIILVLFFLIAVLLRLFVRLSG
ncbi:hypothetical protein HF673_20080 [Acidithiobacillus thiooxidans]|uniref:hypothetical protein n=1 Tax=Acidithiobacillus thiooxidans TaxID=930 RepID=UPI001C06FF53|nr:hypothetical protein [Acidithiobacillus thiooxidans]MBU2837959.1 hypothetical protein [Acidithiobacillus thiooxidans]